MAKLSTATQDLWLVLKNVWNNLPAEFLQKLCASVPKRIDAVLKVKGGHTINLISISNTLIHCILLINKIYTSIFESFLSLQHFFIPA